MSIPRAIAALLLLSALMASVISGCDGGWVEVPLENYDASTYNMKDDGCGRYGTWEIDTPAKESGVTYEFYLNGFRASDAEIESRSERPQPGLMEFPLHFHVDGAERRGSIIRLNLSKDCPYSETRQSR